MSLKQIADSVFYKLVKDEYGKNTHPEHIADAPALRDGPQGKGAG